MAPVRLILSLACADVPSAPDAEGLDEAGGEKFFEALGCIAGDTAARVLTGGRILAEFWIQRLPGVEWRGEFWEWLRGSLEGGLRIATLEAAYSLRSGEKIDQDAGVGKMGTDFEFPPISSS